MRRVSSKIVHIPFLTRETLNNIQANVRVKWEALGHPNNGVRGRTNTLQTSVKRKNRLQAVDERVNSAIPLVFASHIVEQHPLYLSDVVDTIGQLAHSQTDPLGHASTAADRETQ